MKAMFAILLVLLFLSAVGCGKKTDYPTPPGKYHAGQEWLYSYEIVRSKTPSEIRLGQLYYQGQIIGGTPGSISNTVFGPLMFFNTRNNQGWLNTLANNVPVFDRKGRPLPAQSGVNATNVARP